MKQWHNECPELIGLKMDLFGNLADPAENLLPMDGTVNYYGPILGTQQADQFFQKLMQTVDWRHDEVIIYGKRIATKRKVAWYGDQGFCYTYSKVTKSADPWTKELLELRGLVQSRSGEEYNSCLLNLYHSGDEGMSWHSDAEVDLKPDGAIGSLSLGATRRFSFRHKMSDHRVDVNLEHGSLLVMKDTTQSFWKHSLPKTKKVKSPRISLTFRTIQRQ
ncbi:alpha-ketoglutarate-dependent dioxygenase AlkB family protein [Leisingera aquimarina]|uniref:alpha-ketoglutarate-dependent dioxygenase AlkB family protein n=1 Tax=Leisingera aquimarina TaxID=476529 RepID=UPI001B7FDBDD|nr:alpha-ketoglutarate-dependent dioxygenase AlkB [Leisingera aquimarina]